ncbi:MAG: glycosyltransferase family 2 protein [Planctomycetes bacterium]|nr:glycosyltransferase family 2 protein [Planctomycetota bacterium]
MPDPRFLVAIPVYNERGTVLKVLDKARTYVDDILVIDDGSTDGTAEILAAQSALQLIRHPSNLGYGKSLADAFAYARTSGYDWLITMDCDEQHEPAFLPKFQAAAKDDQADLISGSRYQAGLTDRGLPPPDRRRINARITALLNERLGLDLTDAFCGFKAYRVSVLADLCITEPGYAMPLQVWVQAVRAGWRVAELPVRLIYHDTGRRFGGGLDDPSVRFNYYLNVLETELERHPTTASLSGCDSIHAPC